MKTTSLAVGLAALFFALPALASDAGMLDKATAEKVHPSKPPYSPYADRNYPTQPYFGDTHLHTSFSMDAGAFGARLGPREAYRFARGEQILSNTGQPVKLSRVWVKTRLTASYSNRVTTLFASVTVVVRPALSYVRLSKAPKLSETLVN